MFVQKNDKVLHEIPEELLPSFTMDNQIPIVLEYRDDSTPQVQKMINQNFTKEIFEKSLERVDKREQNYYGPTDTWLYQALLDYPIKDKTVCIIGSTYPWYETISVYFGAKKVVVYEYSERKSFHELIEYKHPDEHKDEQFDVCINISSIEHDGLTRYGDPLHPNGDLVMMKKLKKYVKKDGIMFLAVPIGEDKLIFNCHRIYGNIRFPLLIENWKAIEHYGFYQGCMESSHNNERGTPYQPVVVLKNEF